MAVIFRYEDRPIQVPPPWCHVNGFANRILGDVKRGGIGMVFDCNEEERHNIGVTFSQFVTDT